MFKSRLKKMSKCGIRFIIGQSEVMIWCKTRKEACPKQGRDNSLKSFLVQHIIEEVRQ